MSRPAAVGFVLAFLLVTAIAPVGVGTAAVTATDGVPGRFALQQDFDSTEFRITVYENGSARWTIRYEQQLNESEVPQFEAFAEEFNNGSTDLFADFKRRARALVQDGGNVTGRPMSATDFSKRAYVEDTYGTLGVVQMSFRWSNFARVDGDRVIVGDVFKGGLYIGPNQSLVILHGPDLSFESYDPQPDSIASDSLTWRGERSFPSEHPSVLLVPPSQVNTTDPEPPTESPTGPTEGGVGVLPFVALGFAVLIGGVVAYAYRSGALSGGGATSPTADDSPPPGAPDPEPVISDEELLSDEDRVVDLLEQRGGRMKQVNIVEETGWSKSKVSMLLSDMEDEGHISKLRVGRENIVSLAGQEPDAAGSPFDDEDD